MKIKSEWMLPDLEAARKRTKLPTPRIDSLSFRKRQSGSDVIKNTIFQHMGVRPMKETVKPWQVFWMR